MQVTQLRRRTSSEGNINELSSPSDNGRGSHGGGGGLNGKRMESVDELNALDVLADDTASEEIFGKAFRGGRAAAAGLMARLQREVREGDKIGTVRRTS